LPAFVKIREMIDEKKLGEIRRVYADFGFATNEEDAKRLFDPNLCGGALLDVGLYTIHLAR
jgi:predicted dehydrogenase